MPWSKIDDQFYDHPKTVAAGPIGIALFVCGLSYCSRQLTDGFIAKAQVRRLIDVDDPYAVAEKLIEVGFWEQVNGGYQVHDYLEYNPSRGQVLELRKARVDAGRMGGVASGEARAKQKAKQMLEQNPSKPQANIEAKHEAKTNSQSQSHTQNPLTHTPEEKSSPPQKTGGGQHSPPNDKNAIRAELEEYFASVTKLPKPKASTAKQKKSAAELWWQPLRDIADLAQWDVELAKAIIDQALQRLDGLTISSPKSIAKTALAICAEQARGYQLGLSQGVRAAQSLLAELEG